MVNQNGISRLSGITSKMLLLQSYFVVFLGFLISKLFLTFMTLKALQNVLHPLKNAG